MVPALLPWTNGLALTAAGVNHAATLIAAANISQPTWTAAAARQRRRLLVHHPFSATVLSSAAASTSAGAGPSEGPQALYDAGVAAGTYRPDPLQAVTVGKLQDMYSELRTVYRRPSRPSGLTMVDTVGVKQDKGSWFEGLSTLLQSSSGLAPQPGLPSASIRGLYMFGGVGCGKTMLMDLFVKSAPREFQVTRTHFHDFMLDVHSRLRGSAGEADPLKRVADEIAVTTKVLALDELFVTDVADAMILGRLFGRLWDAGLVLVATSNRAPDKLYEGGLQRQLFLPFIERLKKACVIHDMASPVDYRRLARHKRGLYFVDPDRDEELYEAFLEAGGGVGQPAPSSVEVAMGRVLQVPDALGRAALFDFEELCDRPVAAADYIALAHSYHTLALAGVPAFGPANRSAAYRFVTLVDVLYEARVKLLASAEALPFELFDKVYSHDAWQRRQLDGPPAAGDVLVDNELGFSKDRTISRLTEMQSSEYLLAHAERHEPSLLLALKEAAAAEAAAAGSSRARPAAAAAAVGQR